jgi:hypothetical protein
MLQEANRVKNFSGNVTISLKAEANESFRIKRLHIYNSITSYATIQVERVICGYVRVGGDRGSHAAYPIQDFIHGGAYNYLLEQGIFRPIPVPSGMTLTITGVAQAGAYCTLIYDVFDASDVSASEPNGPEAKEFDYIAYGRAASTLTNGDNLYSVSQTPAQYPAFPFGKEVPSKYAIDIEGILASDFGFTGVTSVAKYTSYYVRLDKERETLFDDDRNGFMFHGVAPSSTGEAFGTGQSIGGDMSTVDQRLPLLFDPPLTFEAGEELNVYVNGTLAAGASTAIVADTEIAMICKAKRQ